MSSVEIRAFVFTDIVGSTRLKKLMPGRDSAARDRYFADEILRPHRKLIEATLSEYEGRLISTQGDGHFLEFTSPIQAVMWAIAVQERHQQTSIPTPDEEEPLGVKIGIHMGPASADPHDANNYVGTSVDYASRLVELGTRGKIIVSEVIATFVREEDIAGIALHEHGVQDFAGIGDKRVFEVLYGEETAGPLKGSDKTPQPVPRDSSPVAAADSVHGLSTMQQPRAGIRIKDYELLEEIGEGGMGKVFRARHTGMGRICVLKLIKDSLLQPGNEEVIERFYREIQIIAQLKHPNIVQAYHSSSRDDDYHFLVMEYIDGTALDEWIELDGRVPLADACEIVRQTACGLQCIHENGLVHRDIKPSNLLIARAQSSGGEGGSGNPTSEGQVKILDLGLALLVDDSDNRVTEVRDRAMGTAFYMAPEQWKSTSVDIRADIYALGCTFYHMLGGDPPFAASKFNQRHAHEQEPPPPLDSSLAVPQEVWQVILKMLSKDASQRFAQPQAVAESLASFATDNALGRVAKLRQRALPPRPAASDTPSGPEDETMPLPSSGGTGGTAVSPKPRSAGHRAARLASLALLLLLVAVVLFFALRPNRSPRVIGSAHEAAATHFILTMPGMNGGWWFDEIPWFFPELRMHLLQQLSVDEYLELQRLSQQRDVQQFYDRLRDLSLESLRAEVDGAPIVSDAVTRRFQVLRYARPFDEVVPGSEDDSVWGKVAAQLREQRGDSANFTAADLHLLGLLEWKLDSNQLPTDSNGGRPLFVAARDGYHVESQPLKALCIADYAFIKRRLRQWRDAVEDFASARSTVPQLAEAAPFAVFTYAMESEARLYDTSKPLGEIPGLFGPQGSQPFTSALDDDHPLRALLLSREALYYLETWKLEESESTARRAHQMFEGLPEERKAIDLYFRSRQFMAMAQHFRGKASDAKGEFEDLLQFIDRLQKSDKIAEQEKPRWQPLKPNLLGRLADAQLFGLGDARAAAATWEEATREGQSFEHGYRAPYVARLQYKKAIAYQLAGETEKAQQSFEEGDALAAKMTLPKELDVFRLHQQAAAAFVKPESERYQPLLAILETTTGRAGRDDMQMLIFICQYLLEMAPRAPDVIDAERADSIELGRDALAAPLGHDGLKYLERVEAAVKKLTQPGAAVREADAVSPDDATKDGGNK